MKDKLKKLIQEKLALAKSLYEKTDVTAEEKALADTYLTEAEAVKTDLDRIERAFTLEGIAKPESTPPPDMPEVEKKLDTQMIPARPRMGRVKYFEDAAGVTKEEQAYRFGRFCAASLFGHEKSAIECREKGIPMLKAMSEGVNTAGGFLVPDEFDPTLIRLVEQYGAFRRRAQISRMARDTKNVPRRTGGVTAYWVSEGNAPTASQMAVDNVKLIAKKLAAIIIWSSELDEDSLINIGDELMQEIALAFAQSEDNAAFLGDGTSTYGGVTGLSSTIQKTVTDAGGTWTTDAHKLYNPSVVGASGNLWSEVAMADLTAMVGSVLSTVNENNCAWFCHRLFYWSVMVKLLAAQGGSPAAEAKGPLGGGNTFLGYPVEYVQVMPSAAAASSIPLYFGDMAMAAAFGDRRERTLALSDQYKFAEDQLAIRGTERLDINVHDVGTANSSAASQVMGPISALALNNA